jgi:hypothetical protein
MFCLARGKPKLISDATIFDSRAIAQNIKLNQRDTPHKAADRSAIPINFSLTENLLPKGENRFKSRFKGHLVQKSVIPGHTSNEYHGPY